MPEPDDQQLLGEFARTNSEEAFAGLVERHINLVYSTALRFTGNPQAAEEVSQAVFIILARKAPGLRRGTVLSGWLYQTARLTAANFMKGEMRRQRREQEAYMQSTLNAPDATGWEEIAPLLDEAMGGLGETDRNAVVLRYFENKSAREVAAALKLTEAAAHKRTHRALEKLRKFFTKRGMVLTGGIFAGAVSANSIHAAPVGLAKTISTAAVVKGAIASTSTLTLVKGTLKFMAWSKAKTAAVTTAVVLLTAGGAGLVADKYHIVHAIRAAFYPNIQGTWEGIMPLGGTGTKRGEGTGTHIVLQLSKISGVYVANINAVDVGRSNVPVARVVYDFPNIQIIVNPRRNSVYIGKLNAKATSMDFNSIILRRTHAPTPAYQPLEESDFEPRPDSALQGYWKGGIVLRAGHYPSGLGDRQFGDWNGDKMEASNTLPLNLKIAEKPDGTFRAELDSPMQGADGQPASLDYDHGAVNLEVNSNAGKFQGELDSARRTIKGTWIQGGKSVPAFFQRADYVVEEAQTGVEDYSFTSASDLQGHWKGAWSIPLGTNTITIPLTLDIGKLPDGSYAATLANVEQLGNESPIPVSTFEYSAPNLHMKWKWAGGAYDGKLENGKIAGTWLQGGGGFPLVFERQN
ncbi:MAG TPA: sigma-70 family RNA polymerase sigma factor [Pseudomonadales bacterium]|nr:sigma-70 family RNA polymerase sigma factor [Pseudomonadales bacterium]